MKMQPSVSLLISSIIVKTWNLALMKEGLKSMTVRTISVHRLLTALVLMLLIELVILAVWGATSMPHPELVLQDTQDNKIIEKCSWGDHEIVFLIVQVAYFVCSDKMRLVGRFPFFFLTRVIFVHFPLFPSLSPVNVN